MLEQLLLALFGFTPEHSDEKPRAIVIVSNTPNYIHFAKSKIKNKEQFKCFDEIMQRESSWRTVKNPELADNPRSSAYGIPQALPGSRMRSAGYDWATNPITQIKWAIDYIDERYGTSCKALEHHNKKGWY